MHFGWFRPEAKLLMTNKIDRKYAGRKYSANLQLGPVCWTPAVNCGQQ